MLLFSERVEVHDNLLQIVENKADAIQNSIFQENHCAKNFI